MKAPDHRGGPAQGRVLPGCTGAVQCKFSDGDQRPGDGQLPAFGAAGSGTPQGGDPQRGSGGPGGGDHELPGRQISLGPGRQGHLLCRTPIQRDRGQSVSVFK